MPKIRTNFVISGTDKNPKNALFWDSSYIGIGIIRGPFGTPRNCKISLCDLTRDVLAHCLVPEIDIVRVFFFFF